MTSLLALWICSLCAGAVYYSLPQQGMRLDIYSIGLWILSSSVFVVSAMILVVSLITPWPMHPTKW